MSIISNAREIAKLIQDAGDANRIWLYEIYTDEAAFQAHQRTPHYTKFHAVAGEWREAGVLEGAALGSYNIWPTDGEGK